MGAKRAFELFPGGLKARSRAERKKRFSKLQRQAVTAAAAHAASASHGAPVSLCCICLSSSSGPILWGRLIRKCMLSTFYPRRSTRDCL